ncbi:MAG: ComF family protein [Dehalococcoidales bacterium]|nr:ComF family protein [Dehalococcoidales bacterium]
MVRVLPQLAWWWGGALDLLFPRWCVGCGREGDFICHSCRQLLPRVMPPLCPLCGQPQASGRLCPGCVSWQAQVDGIRSPFRFDGVIRQAVYQLKYRNLRAIAAPLARLVNDYLNTYPVSGEVLVPIPLHPKRLRERGYNQSYLLARELGKLANLPVVADCLVRRRYALPQARTSAVAERRINVADAFTCLDDRLRHKQVILIDDVTTSGATLDAGAAALKAAGATSVWGLALAREI